MTNAQARFSCGASADPTDGQAPLTVQFKATPSGGVPPYSFQWAFGDGGSSTDQNPSHIYEKPGTFSWSLDAHDSSGAGVIALGTITVTASQSSIYLESLQDNGATKNLGYIIFDASVYSLPVTILKDPSKYEATYKPDVSSSFVKWETTDGVSVSDAGKETTTVTVSGSGTLRAIYKSLLPDVYLESLQDDSSTKNLGSITFDKTTYALPTDISQDLSAYEATYNPEAGSSFVKWETSGSVLASDSGSQTTEVEVKGSGTLRAIYKSSSPIIHLESLQDDDATSNKGSITFDGVTYALPTDIFKDTKEYEAKYTPDSGCSFVSWKAIGGVVVIDAGSQTTKVDIKESGSLRTIYSCNQPSSPVIHLESIQDNGVTSNKGSVTFDAITCVLPSDVFKDPKEYEAEYSPSASTSFVRWETTGDISVSDPTSEATTIIVKGSGTLTAIYTSEQGYGPPVGGQLKFVNKFAILAPYLALGGLIGVGSTLYAIRKRRYPAAKPAKGSWCANTTEDHETLRRVSTSQYFGRLVGTLHM